MSDTSDRLRRAQKVLDRCGGDLAEAMTYAAFRLPVRRVLDETWPERCAHDSETGFLAGSGRRGMLCEQCGRITDEWWEQTP